MNQPQQRDERQTARLFFTQNNVPDRDRRALVELLNQTLADTTDLLTQTKYAHWNVKGMQFYELHLLFDDFADVLFEHTDAVAERATALGGEAMGTVRMASTNSRIPELRTDVVTGPEYVEALANSVAVHGANLRNDIGTALTHGDEDTADLLTELSREVDKYLWFLEAHLQQEPVHPTVESRTARPRQGTSRRGRPNRERARRGRRQQTPQQGRTRR
ncbi:DNA starvation/stationary phase protection protein Dps [Haladaptatus sp. NG-WS-4]